VSGVPVPRCSLAAALVAAACAARAPAPVADATATVAAVAAVAAATNAWLDGLPAAQRADAQVSFADGRRTAWAFVPGRYPGVELGAQDAASVARCHALLQSLLSAGGFAKTMAIVQLETLLRAIEGRSGRDASHRDPGRYALLVCGEPAPRGAFAVRLQGHHVSLHFTFFAGALVGATPHFLGSNPHELREGPHAGTRILAAEEDRARELLRSCDEAQRARACIAEQAPADVLLGPGHGEARLGAKRGLPVAAMTPAQRTLAWSLLEGFADNLRGEFAALELERLRPRFGEVVFAWAGGRERGEPHYWRLHGPTFAIEYDNTQNDANHVHVVWRDFERDFGGDPLREHVLRQHAPE
jgi:hypothetical protein